MREFNLLEMLGQHVVAYVDEKRKSYLMNLSSKTVPVFAPPIDLYYEIDDAIWMIPTRKLVSRRFPREGNRGEERGRGETEKRSGAGAAMVAAAAVAATMNGCPIRGERD